MAAHVNEEYHETIPLDDKVEIRRKDDRKRYSFSREKIAVIVVVVILVIAVIVLAVLVGVFASKSIVEPFQPTTESWIPPVKTTSSTSEPTTVPHVEPVTPTTPGTEAWWNPRLPKNIIPKHYDLYLNISLVLGHYEGGVEIEVDVKEHTDLVILHADSIVTIQQTQIRRKNSKDAIPLKNYFMFEKHKYFVIQMEENLQSGLYIIQMSFNVFLTDDIFNTGLFKIQSIDETGKLRNFTATQFEDQHAREAFPCFDEPAMKATFNITIAHQPAYIALTNMPVYKTQMIRGQQIDYFMKTNVVMPTYLIAIVVGEFESIEAKTKNNITMRYFSQPPYVDDLNYVKSIGGKMMTSLEQVLDMKYPLPKEDMVALPSFPSYGMENWGLILYLDHKLLWSRNYSTESSKLEIAAVVSHELAHMWFGNVVTLEWWNDIWLNEGLAKYFEYVIIPLVEPDWKNQDRAIYKILPVAMYQDVSTSTRPISMDADRVKGVYDLRFPIFYNKAMYILRMLAGVIGEKTFLQALRIYLKRHAYSNVVTDDLWRTFGESSCSQGGCVDIKQIMDPWTLQAGFPVVSFKRINASHYTVNQTRFTEGEGTFPDSKFGYSWVIPLTYAIKDKGRQFTWMNMTSAVIEWDGSGWIKANTDHNGFYVTEYDERNWLALAQQLKDNHTVFSTSDRAGLLFDLYQTRTKMNYSTALTVIEYMMQETEYVPWRVLFDTTIKLFFKNLSKSSTAYRYFLKYLVFLGKLQYDRLGFHDTGTAVDKVSRPYFLHLFCKAGEKSCIEKARQIFRSYMKDPAGYIIPSNIREVVFYYGIAYGGLEEWDFLYKQFFAIRNKLFRDSVLYGLAASREPWIIERYLRYLLDGKQIPKSFHVKGLKYVAKFNPQTTWGFLRFYDKLYADTKSYEIHVTFREVIEQFSSEYRLEEIKSFQKSSKRGFSLSDLEERIEWRKKNEKDIELALQQLLDKNKILY